MKEGFTRIRREVETKWVAEYCAKFYPDFPVRYNVRLGPPREELVRLYGLEKALRMSQPWRVRADALVIKPDELILIEGKLYRPLDGLSKLPMYKSLIPSTPELAAYKHLPVRMQLLVVEVSSSIEELARQHGVELVKWAPTWVIEVWREKDLYWTKEAVELRERRKEVLRRLGFGA